MGEEPTFKDCAASYAFNGKRYALNFPAESLEDADARLRAIRTTAVVDGWPCYSVKMPGAAAYASLPFMAALAWLLNLFRSPSKEDGDG